MRRSVPAGLLVGALLGAGVGCGGSGSAGGSEAEKRSEKSLGKAADTSTCVADATPYAGATPSDYPADFPLPRGAVLYSLEDRGRDGVIATAVVKASLKQVLRTLNGTAQEQGFEVTSGETEEHDAEANWSGNGHRGRWAIKDSATCRGEVVIQVLATAD